MKNLILAVAAALRTLRADAAHPGRADGTAWGGRLRDAGLSFLFAQSPAPRRVPVTVPVSRRGNRLPGGRNKGRTF